MDLDFVRMLTKSWRTAQYATLQNTYAHAKEEAWQGRVTLSLLQRGRRQRSSA